MADQPSQDDAAAGRHGSGTADLPGVADAGVADAGVAGRADGVTLSLDGTALVLSNEFASVTVAVDYLGNGPRLAIRDPAGGREIMLDPLELQALAWCRHGELRDLLRPSHKESRLHADDDEADE